MNNFTFYNPTKIIFGQDEIKNIGKSIRENNVKKLLVIYGKGSVFKTGVYDQTINSLKDNNIKFLEFGGIKANPILSKVYEAINIIKKQEIDGVLAIGGGSVIDTAKTAAAGALYDSDIWEIFEGKGEIKKALPIFTVLTVSATGSEMDAGAVITKENEYKKWSFGSPKIYPTTSIIDPTIQFTLPKQQTISGAIDTMSHTFEFYFDGTKNRDLINEISEGILRTVIKHGKILVDKSDSYNSRSQLALSATLALNGLTSMGSKGGDWSSHIIEESLSAYTDVTHGIGLAIILPAWMKYVYKKNLDQFERFAEKVFGITEGSQEEKAIKAIESLKNFYRELGAPTSLREINIKDENLRRYAENAALKAPLGTLKKLYKNDILEILKIAYD